MKMVFASNNKNKFYELNALVKDQSAIELIPQTDLNMNEIEETGLTFIENALQKARYASRMARLPAIADDSGLVVPALNGAPGIYSARFAGYSATAEDNIKKLLEELKDGINRQAYYYCVLVCILNEQDPIPLMCEGKWKGEVSYQPQGNQGFGYDPIFYLRHENKTAAELPLAIKNKISHRGLALQLLMQRLPEKI